MHQSLNHVQLFVTPCIVACPVPLSMELSRQEYWSGQPFPFPRNLPNPGIEPRSPALHVDSLPSEPPEKPQNSTGNIEKASLPGGTVVGSTPGLGRFPGVGNGNPLQYSRLKNSMDRGAWWVAVHGVTKSWTQLSDFTYLLTQPLLLCVVFVSKPGISCPREVPWNKALLGFPQTLSFVLTLMFSLHSMKGSRLAEDSEWPSAVEL